MTITTYLANKLLDHVFGGVPYSAPTVYVALLTASAEVTGGSYQRQPIDPFTAASGGANESAEDVVFPEPTANWGTVTRFAYYDAVTGGNKLDEGTCGPITISEGDDAPTFSAGTLTVSLA